MNTSGTGALFGVFFLAPFLGGSAALKAEAPVGHDVAADGVILGKLRPEHVRGDLVRHQDGHVVDLRVWR